MFYILLMLSLESGMNIFILKSYENSSFIMFLHVVYAICASILSVSLYTNLPSNT